MGWNGNLHKVKAKKLLGSEPALIQTLEKVAGQLVDFVEIQESNQERPPPGPPPQRSSRPNWSERPERGDSRSISSKHPPSTTNYSSSPISADTDAEKMARERNRAWQIRRARARHQGSTGRYSQTHSKEHGTSDCSCSSSYSDSDSAEMGRVTDRHDDRLVEYHRGRGRSVGRSDDQYLDQRARPGYVRYDSDRAEHRDKRYSKPHRPTGPSYYLANNSREESRNASPQASPQHQHHRSKSTRNDHRLESPRHGPRSESSPRHDRHRSESLSHHSHSNRNGTDGSSVTDILLNRKSSRGGRHGKMRSKLPVNRSSHDKGSLKEERGCSTDITEDGESEVDNLVEKVMAQVIKKVGMEKNSVETEMIARYRREARNEIEILHASPKNRSNQNQQARHRRPSHTFSHGSFHHHGNGHSAIQSEQSVSNFSHKKTLYREDSVEFLLNLSNNNRTKDEQVSVTFLRPERPPMQSAIKPRPQAPQRDDCHYRPAAARSQSARSSEHTIHVHRYA